MKNSRYAQRYLKYNRQYEKLALGPLNRVFHEWGNSIPWADLTKSNYKKVLNKSFDIDLMFDAYRDIYTSIGLIHGRRVGRGINRSLKEFTYQSFATVFEMGINAFLREFGVERIVSVKRTFFEYIVDLIDTRIADQMPLVEVARSIKKKVDRKDFYQWQAERIARTEATASANYSAIQAGETSGFVMEKVWISTQDKRTRRIPEDTADHWDMDGQTRGLHFNFKVPDEILGTAKLQYPGDPKAPAYQVINCRCAVSVVAKRDLNGRLIRTK